MAVKSDASNDKSTEYIQRKVEEKISNINDLYCREDLEAALNEYAEATADNVLFRKNDLTKICKTLNIDTASLLEDHSLLENVPDRKSVVEEKLVSMIYDLHFLTPSPADNMERIVRNLAPEYKNDSVRLAILKKIIKGTELCCRQINTDSVCLWAKHRMTADQRNAFETANNEKKAEMVIDVLDETVFNSCGNDGCFSSKEKLNLIVSKTDQVSDKYLLYVGKEQFSLTNLQFDESTKDHIRKAFKKAKIEYRGNDNCVLTMRRMQLSDCLSDEIIEEAISNYKKKLGTVFYVSQKQNNEIRKPVWELFDNALKDAAKKDNSSDLTELCNDLAKGYFRTNNGETRRRLLWFAIFFDMTLALKEDEITDKQRDIEKNLFEDYYCDNMKRFLSEEFKSSKTASMFENEPTGEGLNYKNYVEIIYIYYLYHKEMKLTPGQRIDCAEKMIRQCASIMKKVKEYSDAYAIANDPEKTGTEEKKASEIILRSYSSKTMQKYKELAEYKQKNGEPDELLTYVFKSKYANVISNFSEKEMCKFVCKTYRILPPSRISGDTTPRIRISSGEREAFVSLNDILDFIYYEYSDCTNSTEGETDDDMYNVLPTSDFVSVLGDMLRSRYPNETDFLRMVDQIEKRLRFEIEISGSARTKILLRILYILYHNPEQQFSNETIKNRISSGISQVNGININRCIRILEALGFVIRHQNDSNGRSLYSMGKISYKDAALQNMLNILAFYNINSVESENAMENLILMKNPKECKVTRSRLVAAKAIQYVIQNAEMNYSSIPEIYSDFRNELNDVLESARYQSFNEKNIFDLYIAVSIFTYFNRQSF